MAFSVLMTSFSIARSGLRQIHVINMIMKNLIPSSRVGQSGSEAFWEGYEPAVLSGEACESENVALPVMEH